MSDRADYFRQLNIKRAKSRAHRQCPVHRKPRAVCESCAKVYCPKCPPHECRTATAPIPKSTSKSTPILSMASRYRPPSLLKPMWTLVHPLGAIRIEPHPDSGGYIILFPPQALDVVTAGELADKFWLIPDIRVLAEPTPFRAGRIGRQWWVSFFLKESPHDSTPTEGASA